MMQSSPQLRIFPALCSSAALLVGGCLAGTEPDAAESEVSAEVRAANGMSVNGMSVNGMSVNGMSMNGMSVNGVSINGMSVNGMSVNGVSVTGSQLHAVSSTGDSLDGAELVGTTMLAQLSDWSSLELRIDGTALLPAPNADLRTYTISYHTASGWSPLCPNGNEALMYPGTWNMGTIRHQWDSNMFSLACRGSTFAKCSELGYKGDSLLDTYHAACTRALRADYCGDGVSHTINGTLINLFDKLGKQVDTESWTVESNWTPDGAVCINKARVLTSLVEPNVPACVAERARVNCVTQAWQGQVLIRTEVNK